ncbi:peroxiredoxin-like family protein [Naasia lichenicola]|uniref:thioredoxin-dependent peroxiredoxin n=1 Tax=Naasia lichenicola TaxID=2565933 RepID=A0A4S4FU48_9MICO|nr:peroxiredoxin-like family protein [Naasia lichenicola]THG33315.1 AhpC/TSA family protein [Naasia lichenicola]
MSTIADQVTDFNVGFNEQIGPRLAGVFADEQAGLTAGGVPSDAVSQGSIIPDARLVDAAGAEVSLYDAIGEAPAVLVFYRGAWCPYCNITLKHYQRTLLPGLNDRGIALIAISPQTPDGSSAAVANGELAFTVLSDPSNVLIEQLGIKTEPNAAARSAHTDLGFDVADSNADATADIPFPTVLVIDSGRSVTFADVHVDYTTRTEVATILSAVDSLARVSA